MRCGHDVVDVREPVSRRAFGDVDPIDALSSVGRGCPSGRRMAIDKKGLLEASVVDGNPHKIYPSRRIRSRSLTESAGDHEIADHGSVSAGDAIDDQ